jgi:hypothetical protein
MLGVRATPDLRSRIESWAARQPDRPSLSEAIRRLVEAGLVAASAPKQSRRSIPVAKLNASNDI